MKAIIYLVTLLVTCSVFAQKNPSETGTEIQTQIIEQEDIKEDINKEKAQAKEGVNEAQKLAASATKQAKRAETELERALAEFLSKLQTYRAEVSKVKLEKVKSIESKITLMETRTESVKQHESKIQNDPQKLNRNDLKLISQIWREIVDETIGNLFSEDSVELDPPPTQPTSINLIGDKFVDLKEQIKNTIITSQKNKFEAETDLARIHRSQRQVGYKLLLNAGRVRAGVMKILIAKKQYSVWSFDSSIIKDYSRELQVVPFRFLATLIQKYFDFKTMSSEGAKGWVKISQQALLLLFVFALPLLIFRIFRMFSSYLDNLRKQIFTSSQLDYKKRTKLTLLIGKLNPYLPWFFAYIAIKISNSLLLGSLLEPIAVFLPYMNIYVLYRGFLIFFSSLLARTLLSKNLDRIRNKQPKVQSTALKLSSLFFIEWALLHAAEDAVRQALIYNLTYDIIIYINLIIIAFEARRWKNELLELSSQWMNKKLQAKVETLSNFVFELIFYPFLFIGNISFLSFRSFYQWLSQFEVGKKISSEIFKKRLEEANDRKDTVKGELDPEYINLFLGSDTISSQTRVSLSKSPYLKCVTIIEKWLNDVSHEDLILLYGNFGIGKSTILSPLAENFEKKIQIKQMLVKDKIITKHQLYKELSKVFETELSCTADFENLDKTLPKTVFIIDDIHNLYLNTTDGLGAYRALINLTSLQLNNLFWCFSCNERALAHLNGLFGTNHFIGSKIELLSWTDSEIQDLIMKRHRKSKYKLKFDQVISAVHKGDILEAYSGLEIQFFRLLWGQSRGNPLTAQELWLSAAHKESANSIRIAVPEFTNPRTLSDLNDETLMVYAALLKHENLSFDQLVEVCGLTVSAIRQALKFGEDGMILKFTDDKQWRIHPKAQYVVQAQLSGRNFIYG